MINHIDLSQIPFYLLFINKKIYHILNIYDKHLEIYKRLFIIFLMEMNTALWLRCSGNTVSMVKRLQQVTVQSPENLLPQHIPSPSIFFNERVEYCSLFSD